MTRFPLSACLIFFSMLFSFTFLYFPYYLIFFLYFPFLLLFSLPSFIFFLHFPSYLSFSYIFFPVFNFSPLFSYLCFPLFFVPTFSLQFPSVILLSHLHFPSGLSIFHLSHQSVSQSKMKPSPHHHSGRGLMLLLGKLGLLRK